MFALLISLNSEDAGSKTLGSPSLANNELYTARTEELPSLIRALRNFVKMQIIQISSLCLYSMRAQRRLLGSCRMCFSIVVQILVYNLLSF